MKLRQLFSYAILAALCIPAAGSEVNVNADGTVALPYFEDFETEDHIGLLDIVDSNGDGRSWMYSDIIYDMRNRAGEDVDSDDWLFLPPMEMRADCSYALTFSARAVYNMYTERLEVKAGQTREADVDAMTMTLIQAEDIVGKRMMRAVMTVPSDGVYRIAFHAVSKAGAFRLAIDDVRVDAPMSALRPGVPTDVSIIPADDGVLSATLSFRVPAVTVNGINLASVDRLEVRRSGEQVAVYDNPAPGSVIEREVPTQQGDNSFTITAFNEHGEGEAATISVFTGDDVPMEPSNLRMEVRDGKAYLSWDAPTQGENGGFIDPAALTYEIQRRSDFQYVESSYSGTEYVDVLPANINSRPRQLYYCVKAVSRGGKSTISADSNRFITGDSSEAPFSESFAGQNYDADHYWHSINYGERWNLDGTLVFDGDGGAAKFAPANPGENSLFYTSRISLKSCPYPLLTFYYWHVKNSDMLLEVMVSKENGEFSTVRAFDFSEDHSATGWKKGAVLLDGFSDAEYVLVGWRATAGMIQTVTALDAIDIRDVPRADLAVSLSAPLTAAEGQPVIMTVAVSNTGATDAADFKVKLNHEALGQVAERECALLPVGQTAEFEFSVPFHCSPGLDNGAYEARIDWDGDTDFTNDADRSVVALRSGRLPKPTGLIGERSDGSLTLRWTAPALSGAVTDDVEDYDPFLISEIGDWITIDRDRQQTYKIAMPVFDEEQEQVSFELLEYPNAGAPMAFQVFNPKAAGAVVDDKMCHSGDQVFAAFAAVRERNNDWLISPELSGEAQTMRFWAISAGDEMWGQEQIELYWSDGLSEPELFEPLSGTIEIPNGRWTEISTELPEGARHFAVRCVSEIVMALFIDDITYTPKPSDATLTGYEVFRNGEMVAAIPAGSESYTDTEAPAEASYRVRAVYAEGFSPFSSEFNVSDLGGSALEFPELPGVSVTTSPGLLTITGNGTLKVAVYTLTGALVADREGIDQIALSLPGGIYIIDCDGVCAKVAIP